MLNQVTLIGRLTKDPDLRYTPQGKAVANFTLAVDRGFKDKETGEGSADFIRIVCWEKTAEIVAKNLAKGRRVCVEGSIKTGSYDKEGVKIYTTDVLAKRVIFLDWGDKKDGETLVPEMLADEDVPF